MQKKTVTQKRTSRVLSPSTISYLEKARVTARAKGHVVGVRAHERIVPTGLPKHAQMVDAVKQAERVAFLIMEQGISANDVPLVRRLIEVLEDALADAGHQPKASSTSASPKLALAR